MEFDEYSAYVSDHVDLNEIVIAICKSGAQWKISLLSQKAKIWNYFVGASSHLSDVTRDWAILIFCILSSKTIDFGSILHASIMHSVKGVLVGLYFPSLITALYGKGTVI